MKRSLPKIAGISTSAITFLTLASNVLAQSSTASATKGGTSSSLPDAGTTEITYFIFVAGVVLFVFGTLKFVASYRKS